MLTWNLIFFLNCHYNIILQSPGYSVAVYKEISLLKILFVFLVCDILGAYESHCNLLHFTILTTLGDLHKPAHSKILHFTILTKPGDYSFLCYMILVPKMVNLQRPLCTSWSHMGGVVIYLHSFLTSEVGAAMGGSGQVDAPDRITP